MTTNRKDSYTSANAIPIKIFRNADLVSRMNYSHQIPATHIQVIPTNKCNLNCTFCSCKERDKSEELSVEQVKGIVDAVSHTCKAVTVTGGGEPLMHRDINEIVGIFADANIKVGLVTNGLLLKKLSRQALGGITWCRISCSDERTFPAFIREDMSNVISNSRWIDWAFSYVVQREHHPENLARYIDFANTHKFTHVRVVSDLCDLNSVGEMDHIKAGLIPYNIDDGLVIYQCRKHFDAGAKNCWISLLKPLIGADGKVYPCCGVQYANDIQDLDLPESMTMGKAEDLHKIISRQIPFDGSNCARCYYKDYNDILAQMMEDIGHVEFV